MAPTVIEQRANAFAAMLLMPPDMLANAIRHTRGLHRRTGVLLSKIYAEFVVTEPELLAAVDAAFAITGHGLESWSDPHSGMSPLEAEYSRLTDPGKWRIVADRANAWLTAATDLGLATVEQQTAVQWAHAPGTLIGRSDRVVPHAAGAVPLVVAYSQLGDIDDAGITLGIGDPAVIMAGTSQRLSSSDATGKPWLHHI